MKVSINPPKTPITEGSGGLAPATVPNVCKMPGPPAPFVPTPLPNIGKSGMSPKGYSKTVLIEGKKVAIKGASFGSMGDIASKATGGGLISAATHGHTDFVSPGSMDVSIEGKNVQLLGDATTNNGGSNPNSATTAAINPPGTPNAFKSGVDCEKNKKPRDEGLGWSDCDVLQLCGKVKATNKLRKKGKLEKQPPGRNKHKDYKATKGDYAKVFANVANNPPTTMSQAWLKQQFFHPCAQEEWEKAGKPPNPSQKGPNDEPEMFNPDHVHDCGLGCNLKDITNFKMLSSSVNKSIGSSFAGFDPAVHTHIELPNCDCP